MDGCIDEVNMSEEHPVIDWDDMSEEDRVAAMDLLTQLNQLFDKYTERNDPSEEVQSTQD
jgi:predicted Fe-S protein YdhL (DUF1289 family)